MRRDTQRAFEHGDECAGAFVADVEGDGSDGLDAGQLPQRVQQAQLLPPLAKKSLDAFS
jgi:hypothetical protein